MFICFGVWRHQLSLGVIDTAALLDAILISKIDRFANSGGDRENKPKSIFTIFGEINLWIEFILFTKTRFFPHFPSPSS